MSGQNYLCIQRSRPTENREKPLPAQMEEMYAGFNAWREKFRENIVDLGGRLAGGKVVTSEGTVDGPLAEAKEVIGGYMIISAECLDAATDVAGRCPGLVSPSSYVEVREISAP